MANQKLLAGDCISFRANAAIAQFCFVILATAARSVTQVAAQGVRALGVAQEAATVAGQEIPVAVRPGCVTKVLAAGVIPIGDRVTTAANGRGEVAAAADYVNGWNLGGATANNQIFDMLLRFEGVL